MPKPKKTKKNATKVPMGVANEKIENVIGKLFVTSFTRIHQIIQEDVVKMFEEEYKWADELLEEVKREFSSPVSKIKLLPKTPSAKRKRGRIRKETVIEEAEEKEDSDNTTESVPIACETDANILAYETPPQRTYRTRAASRTAQTKRTTRNAAAKKAAKNSENEDPSNEVQSREDKKTPVLNFNSSTKCDNLTPNIPLKGGTSKLQTSESHVFSPPIGKPGKGHVKSKVHAYEDYIEQNSPSSSSSRQTMNQSAVPETPEQMDTQPKSDESCRETPEAASLGKRMSIHKPLKSTSASRKSLLKSSKIHMNPKLLHTAEKKETPAKKNKLKLRKKEAKDEQDDEDKTSHSETDMVESSLNENSEGKLDSGKENATVTSVESVQTTMNIKDQPEHQAESELEPEMKESVQEQVQMDEPMQVAEVNQEQKEKESEQSVVEEQDASMHSAVEEPLSSSHHESEKDTEEKVGQEVDICMEECENVPSVDIPESESTKDEKRVVDNRENTESEKKDLSSNANAGEYDDDDDDDDVILLSEDEDCKTSTESKQKTDSVTQADDESEETEEEKQPPRASKRTKQRNQPKTQIKSESDSDTDALPPKRTRTKTRKVLENESMETTKPVRQSTRTKQRKQGGASVSSAAGSDTTSEVDSGHGSLTNNSSRTTRSKIRKPKESSATSDGDAHFAVPENPAPRARTTSRKRTLDTEGEEEMNSSLSKKSKRESDESSEVTSDAKSSSNRKGTDTDDERSSQSEDDTPDNVRQHAKIVKPASFLNNLNNKVVRPAGLNFSGVKSFLHQSTPPNKLTVKEQQEQRKRELEEKKKKEAERLQKRELEKKKKIEELRKKREERMRKVNERREQAIREEIESKNRIMKTLEEKSKQADDLKEEKMKEEQERQKLRLKKQEEAEERRRQEEEERARKLKEQEEMEQRNIEFMQRKKEHEEQERLRRKAEERRKFEERMAEFERERIAEHERLKKIEEEKIRERQKLREEREKQLAKERAERERIDTEKRKQKELELKQKMEKIKELEKKRLMEEEKRKQELKERERAIHAIVNKHNMCAQSVSVTNVVSGIPKPNLNSTLTVEQPINSQEKMPNPDSYEMTPAKKFLPQKVSLESYDISDLRSDDSTDEDDAPRKRVPNWALGASLKAALIQQHYHPPDLNVLFTEIVPPDLNELFVKKKARFNKRTSSAIWTSPILKPGMNY